MAGYQTQMVPVRKVFVTAGGTAMVGNVVAGGLIGLGVDAATGAAYDHTPNPVQVTLVPEKAGHQPPRRRGKASTAPDS